jgi:putative hemolysin
MKTRTRVAEAANACSARSSDQYRLPTSKCQSCGICMGPDGRFTSVLLFFIIWFVRDLIEQQITTASVTIDGVADLSGFSFSGGFSEKSHSTEDDVLPICSTWVPPQPLPTGR